MCSSYGARQLTHVMLLLPAARHPLPLDLSSQGLSRFKPPSSRRTVLCHNKSGTVATVTATGHTHDRTADLRLHGVLPA